MKKTFAVFIALAFFCISLPANAAVTAGTSCQTRGQLTKAGSSEFACVAKGSASVWIKVNSNLSVDGAKCSPIADARDRVGYSRDYSKKVLLHCLKEGRFFNLGQIYPIQVNQNTGQVTSGGIYSNMPIQYLKKTESKSKPKTQRVITSSTTAITECKLSQMNTGGRRKGFDLNLPSKLSRDSIIQVIPLQASDAPSTGDPNVDYKDFFQGMVEATKNLSDGTWALQVKSPNKYLMLPKSLKSYRVGSENTPGEARTPEQEQFTRVGLDLAKDEDLNAAYLYLFVAPPSTPSSLFARYSNTYQISLNDRNAVAVFSITKSDPVLGTIHHDFFHLGMGIPDHYGDEEANNKNITQLIGKTGEILGTDRWGNMSGTQMDWIGWDKWIGGFMDDAQVICAQVSTSETVWIKPSATYGASSKLLVIPTGKYTAIAVESMRNIGYNNLLPKESMGALVFSIDLTKTDYGSGINVIRPTSRLKLPLKNGIPGDDALRVGDSINFGGYEIKVIESGDFGDVVKVRKLS